MIKKEIQDLINRLNHYNRWRHGEVIKPPDPKQLSKDIDNVLKILKAYNENTIDNLAEEQNVKPMEDVRDLFGTWPDMKDNFEETINELRHRDIAKTELEIINALMK